MKYVFNHAMNNNMITSLELNSWLNPINTQVVTCRYNVLNYISWINKSYFALLLHSCRLQYTLRVSNLAVL